MATRTWVHRFEGPLAGIWRALADTARYNEAVGFPIHRIEDGTTEAGLRAFLGTARFGPFAVSWTDHPVNWVKERWFEHERTAAKGPFARILAHVDLAPTDEGGCVGHYHLTMEPRGVSGRAILAAGFFQRQERVFHRMAARADRFALGQEPDTFDLAPPGLNARVLGRIEALAGELKQAGHPAGIVDTLVRLIRQGGENDVRRIRPLVLARKLGLPATPTVTASLDAARRGLLDLSWDLLCPRCRGAKVQVASLDQLPTEAHCDTCAIRYDRDFSRNVELTFRPSASLRPILAGEFCLLGPMSMPHVQLHLSLAAGEARAIALPLDAGAYRVRTLEPGPELAFEHAGGELPSITVDDAGIRLTAEPGTVVRNLASTPLTVAVEERAWVKDALTADKVSTLQAFRDLFSDQLLRPGDEVGIARVAILFSDLAGSTALYQKVGEAAAWRRVREHFAWLGRHVREHDGAIVKTIGDAIMAAFADPLDAVRAAIAIQQDTEAFNQAADAMLQLKIGVHAGPSIAVTLNERLDYFGSTTNLAARLQGVAGPGEIVVSAELARDPEVAALVEPLVVEQASVRLRGFESAVPCLRLRAPAG